MSIEFFNDLTLIGGRAICLEFAASAEKENYPVIRLATVTVKPPALTTLTFKRLRLKITTVLLVPNTFAPVALRAIKLNVPNFVLAF